jgi:hypothetical protein
MNFRDGDDGGGDGDPSGGDGGGGDRRGIAMIMIPAQTNDRNTGNTPPCSRDAGSRFVWPIATGGIWNSRLSRESAIACRLNALQRRPI